MQIGDRFGQLVVLEVFREAKRYKVRVRCDCGTEKSMYASNLYSVKSCGCYRRNRMAEQTGPRTAPPEAGTRFGRLRIKSTFYGYRGTNRQIGGWFTVCLCDCGQESTVPLYALKTGNTQSCGRMCGLRDNASTHGEWKTPLHRAWQNMLERCRYAKSGYPQRGITFHPPWKDYVVFRQYILQHLGQRPDGCTLDRINNARGYVPGNVQWATFKEQQRNRSDNKIITANGESLCVAEWAERTGITAETIRARLRYGWSGEDAVTLPPERGRKYKDLK